MKYLAQSIILILGAVICLSGCYLETKVNEEFDQVNNLRALNGAYRNLGKVAPSSIRTFYLSNIIWPNDEKLDHKTIDVIEVENIGEKSLAVRALQMGLVIKEDVFIEGKDFEFAEGRIKLPTKREWTGSSPGSVGPGGYVESIELGVDRSDQGKARESVTGAALVFLMFPLAVSGSEEVRFEKIRNFH